MIENNKEYMFTEEDRQRAIKKLLARQLGPSPEHPTVDASKYCVSKEKSQQIIDNALPITWEWLAGFFQAEGCVSADYNRNLPEIIIAQSDPKILDAIESFIRAELQVKINRSHQTITSPLVPEEHENWRLYVWSRVNVLPVINKLFPLLYTHKKQQVVEWATRLNIVLPDEPPPVMNWDFVGGFYDGDGCCSYANVSRMVNKCIQLNFSQKDEDILFLIKDFLGKGSVQPHPDASELRVFDGVRTGRALTWKLLEHIRTLKNREILVDTVTL